MGLELNKENSRFGRFYFSEGIDDIEPTEEREKVHWNLSVLIGIIRNNELFDFLYADCDFTKIYSCLVENKRFLDCNSVDFDES